MIVAALDGSSASTKCECERNDEVCNRPARRAYIIIEVLNRASTRLPLKGGIPINRIEGRARRPREDCPAIRDYPLSAEAHINKEKWPSG